MNADFLCLGLLRHWFLHYDVINSVSITEIRHFLNFANLQHFLIFHIRPIFRYNFWYNRRLERFKMILRISSRRYMAGILPIRRKTQNNQSINQLYIRIFLIEERGKRNTDECSNMPILSCIRKLNICFACCSCKLILNTKCFVYIDFLDFPLIINVTIIGEINISEFW